MYRKLLFASTLLLGFSNMNQTSAQTLSDSLSIKDYSFGFWKNGLRKHKKDKSVGTALVGKASCGDVIKLQVKIEDGIIMDAKFKTFGCGSAIASSSLATEMIIGQSIEKAETMTNKDISSHLKLPPVKIHCSVLAEEAIKTAIEDYKTKQVAV